VPITPTTEFNRAVQCAKKAFEEWRNVPVAKRMRLISDYTRVVEENQNKIAELITVENGKTLADSRGDIFRGLEVLEQCRSITNLIMGETSENIATDVDCYS